jgi:NAD(P)-dependent dehydrogenase (short-subunit alcohol dehydrogenase family)
MAGLALPVVAAMRPVARMIFLAAWVPTPGLSYAEYLFTPEGQGSLTVPLERVTFDEQGRHVVPDDVAVEIFYHDALPEDACRGLVVYSATKGAVKMFTQGLAREVGPRGITVNAIQSGPIDTDLNPADEWAEPQLAATALKRYGHVEGIAPLVAFVAGPEAGYITGASLTVDGGTNA